MEMNLDNNLNSIYKAAKLLVQKFYYENVISINEFNEGMDALIEEKSNLESTLNNEEINNKAII